MSGESVLELSNGETPDEGDVLPDGAQFCGASGLRGFSWQLVDAPVDSNRTA